MSDKAKFNSRTITLKVQSVTGDSVNLEGTKIKADALTALLISPNPIRKEYDLKKDDFEAIKSIREKMENAIYEMSVLLRSKEKEFDK